ncbi:hypothetical protein Acsp03_45060 [Actinomadura sp. NBRC 104412]|nr:hypothetical protein Acsp03_45060 [Actinomadura sp. NBRC 104412]
MRDDAGAIRRSVSTLRDVEKIIRGTLEEAGVPSRGTWTRAGAGGWAVTLPADADVPSVLAEVPRRAAARLALHNGRRVPEARLRLLVAFAMGPTVGGPDGPVGQGPRVAERLARLVAAQEEAEAPFAVVLSRALYEQYVAPGFRLDLSPDAFRPVAVDGTKAWLA